MGKMLWHLTKSIDGSDADPDAAMDRVFEHPEPNANVGKVIETTGSVLKTAPFGCRRLDTGLTTRHRRAIALDIGARR